MEPGQVHLARRYGSLKVSVWVPTEAEVAARELVPWWRTL